MGGRGASYYAGKDEGKFLNEGKGRGKAHELDISKIKDKGLSGIEDMIRNYAHEEAYFFDEKGRLVSGFKGNAGSVSLPSEQFQQNGYSLTHNHPKSYSDFGGTLSFADVKNHLTSQLFQTRAVAGGQGENHYIMRTTNRANSSAYLKRIAKDYGKLRSQMKEKYTKAYEKAMKQGSSVSNARHVARQQFTGVLNAYWKKTASKYGYEYVNRKK